MEYTKYNFTVLFSRNDSYLKKECNVEQRLMTSTTPQGPSSALNIEVFEYEQPQQCKT